MRDLFDNYLSIRDLIKEVKDPGLLEQLLTSKEYLRNKMFKSKEHLDAILEKDFEDITIQDVLDILYKFADPENNIEWTMLATVGRKDGVGTFAHGLYGLEEPMVDVNSEGFEVTRQIPKPGHYYNPERAGSYDLRRVGFFKPERKKIIKTILNFYRLYQINDRLHRDIRAYPTTWQSETDDFWNGLARWLVKCDKKEAIEATNFDHNLMTDESIDLIKSYLSGKKYNLNFEEVS